MRNKPMGMEWYEYPPDPITVRCASLDDLVCQVKSRRAPVVKPMDEPRMLWIGFYVPKTNEWFVCGLSELKREERDRQMELLSSYEGRESFARSMESKDEAWQSESI
jgi:hypothetical protein